MGMGGVCNMMIVMRMQSPLKFGSGYGSAYVITTSSPRDGISGVG